MSTFENFDVSDVLTFSRLTSSELPFRVSSLGAPRSVSIYYSDVNNTFQYDSKDIIVYDEDAINRQITNILSTPLGSDDFEPTFGSLIPFRLFEPITTSMSWLLRNDTIEALRKWMQGKIELDMSISGVSIIDNNPDNEGYIIDFAYRILRSNVVARYNVAYLR